jgi:hypothetical protein
MAESDMMAKALAEQAAMQAEMDRQMASLDNLQIDSSPSHANSEGGGAIYEGDYSGNEEEQVGVWIDLSDCERTMHLTVRKSRSARGFGTWSAWSSSQPRCTRH